MICLGEGEGTPAVGANHPSRAVIHAAVSRTKAQYRLADSDVGAGTTVYEEGICAYDIPPS
jgi:hypothetical protein